MKKILKALVSSCSIAILIIVSSIASIAEYLTLQDPSDMDVAVYGLAIVTLCMALLLLASVVLDKLGSIKQ